MLAGLQKEEKLILGWHNSHCASVALLTKEGRIVFAAAEERYNKEKLSKGYPEKAISEARNYFENRDICVAYADLPLPQKIWRNSQLLFITKLRKLNSYKTFSSLLKTATSRISKGRFDGVVGGGLDSLTKEDSSRLTYDVLCEHHSSHAASAYYCSGFDDAVVLSVDGVGDCLSAAIFQGHGRILKRERSFFYNEITVGADYETFTAMMGFNPNRHCGKITGLAAYGKYNAICISALDKFFKQSWKAGHKNYFDRMHGTEEEKTIAELHHIRNKIFGNFSKEDLAFSIQYLAERTILKLIRENVADIKRKNIALAGGVFANVKINQKVKELGFKNIFIQPAMDDGGLSLGVALNTISKNGKGIMPYRLPHVFLGSSYGDDEIEDALKRRKIKYQRVNHIEAAIARLVAESKVVARFTGAMEFGPRALGNRSILYDTRDPSVNEWLNERLKRTEFMPFAPATMFEYAEECYKGTNGCEHAAEFMTITFECTPSMKKKSPAVVHVDGTARTQLVRMETNPAFHEILREYHKITGIPSLVNTSFNMHESPIVRTPDDAILSFLAGHLDALAIGSFLVLMEENT